MDMHDLRGQWTTGNVWRRRNPPSWSLKASSPRWGQISGRDAHDGSCSTPPRDRDRNYNKLRSSCCWLGLLGAVHAKVDPLDTELVPIVIDTRLLVARCGP